MDARGNPTTELDPQLVAAYRATDYHVNGAGAEFVLHVDEPSAALAALHATACVGCSALLSACNPASVVQPEAVNAAAGRRLRERLAVLGVACIDALGADPNGRWPAESSVLALGLDRAAARALARDFGQNAILWAGDDAIPRLLLMR